MNTLPAVKITEKAEAGVRFGHPWIYNTEISKPDKPCANGSLIDVYSRKSRYLGTGFYNNHSKITIRLISRNANDKFDEVTISQKIC